MQNILKFGIVLLCIAVHSTRAQDTTPWHEAPVRGIGVNLWAPDWYPESLIRFDADSLAGALMDAHATTGFTFQGFTKDHFGRFFYPTRLGPMHPKLNGRDFMGLYVQAMHRRGLRIFAYYSWPDNLIARDHPEWCQVNAAGKLIGDSFGSPCLNSPYRQLVLEHLKEIITRFPVDGLLMDTMQFRGGGCYCSWCRQHYREATGRELPDGTPDYSDAWRTFIHWRYSLITRIHEEFRSALKGINPALVYTHNAFALRSSQQWTQGEDFEKVTPSDDVVTSIASWGRSNERRDVHLIWRSGLQTRFHRGTSGKPVWMQMGRFPYTRDYQVLPERELALAAWCIVANGGSPFYIDNLYPEGNINELAYERMGAAYAGIARLEEFLTDAEDVPFAALYYSRASDDFSALTHQPAGYTAAFEGAYKILIEGKVPVQIIGESGMTPENLARFKVLVLPQSVVLSNEQLSVIRQFVEQGGGLVCTGEASLAEPTGVTRENFGLADVFGVNYKSRIPDTPTFLQLSPHPVCDSVDPRIRIPVRGTALQTSGRQDVEQAAEIILPTRSSSGEVRPFAFSPADIPPGKPAGCPGIAANTFGAGRCVYFSSDITGSYGLYGYPELRTLFLNALKWSSNNSCPVRVDGPLGLEVHAFTQGNRTILHLVNHTTSAFYLTLDNGGTMVDDGVPLHDIQIRVDRMHAATQQIILMPQQQTIEFQHSVNFVTFVVPEVDLYQCIVIE